MLFIELVGIIATFFVVLSFCFRNIRTVRMINMIGSFVFVLYGILLTLNAGSVMGFISILVVNIILFGINGYHLVNKTHKAD